MSIILPYQPDPDYKPSGLGSTFFDDISLVTISDSSIAERETIEYKKTLKINYYGSILARKISESDILIPELEEKTIVRSYKEDCDQYNVPSVKIIEYALNGVITNLDLEGYGLDEVNVYFICKYLLTSPLQKLSILNLSYNIFSTAGCVTLSQYLQISALKELNLSNCQIGSNGIEVLAEGIEIAPELKQLNLSNCNLGDPGGVFIAHSVSNNEILRDLDLSHNKLYIEAANQIGIMLENNKFLEYLNLTGNYFYPQKEAAMKIAQGLLANTNLKYLNLAWNGICGLEVSKLLTMSIVKHKTLRILNLENNFFADEDLFTFAKGFKRTKILEECYMGGNRWADDTVLGFLTCEPQLKIFSFGYLELNKNLYALAMKMMLTTDIKIIFGGKMFPNPPDTVSFLKVIFDRCRYCAQKPKKIHLKRDMGVFMLKLLEYPSNVVKSDEFDIIMTAFRAKLDKALITQLKQCFPILVGKSKVPRVNIKEMATTYLKMYSLL